MLHPIAGRLRDTRRTTCRTFAPSYPTGTFFAAQVLPCSQEKALPGRVYLQRRRPTKRIVAQAPSAQGLRNGRDGFPGGVIARTRKCICKSFLFIGLLTVFDYTEPMALHGIAHLLAPAGYAGFGGQL